MDTPTHGPIHTLSARHLKKSYGSRQVGRDVSLSVSTGQVVGNQWQITQGLKAGERVIVSNGSAVAPGQQVQAVAAKVPWMQPIF